MVEVEEGWVEGVVFDVGELVVGGPGRRVLVLFGLPEVGVAVVADVAAVVNDVVSLPSVGVSSP